MDFELLKNVTIDYESGLSRFMGVKSLYANMLEKFAFDDNTFSNITKSYEKQDYEGFIRGVHTAKGISGNLSLTELYETSVGFYDMLRKCNCITEQISKQYAVYIEIYNRTIEKIKIAVRGDANV